MYPEGSLKGYFYSLQRAYFRANVPDGLQDRVPAAEQTRGTDLREAVVLLLEMTPSAYQEGASELGDSGVGSKVVSNYAR